MRLAYFVRKYHLFILLGSFAFLLAGALLAPETAQAFASYLTAAVTKYPQINNSKLNECILCHTSNTSPKALNVYGRAFKNSGFNFDTIANLDSDGDGFTNIAEINALTFPGNRADFPQATAVPTATTPPTAIPTATATVPPTATPSPTVVTSPTVTPTPTITPTPCTNGTLCHKIYIPVMMKFPLPTAQSISTPTPPDDGEDENGTPTPDANDNNDNR